MRGVRIAAARDLSSLPAAQIDAALCQSIEAALAGYMDGLSTVATAPSAAEVQFRRADAALRHLLLVARAASSLPHLTAGRQTIEG